MQLKFVVCCRLIAATVRRTLGLACEKAFSRKRIRWEGFFFGAEPGTPLYTPPSRQSDTSSGSESD